MKRLFCLFMACVVSLISAPAAVYAQQEPAPVIFSQEELDQLLAPIALYPDALLTQVLMAATYPLEAVQAARFAKQNPGLRGEALARALEGQPWDPSVKALVEFPAVLTMMDEQLAWTQKLGDAFLAQQDAVMDTVQSLRARAQATGSLRSNQQQRVVMQEQMIVIEPVAPELIYVPYYNPTVVYGRWWWPQRQPMIWVPPPMYRSRSYGDVIATGIAFGIGVAIIDSIFRDARPDWRNRNFVVHDRRRPVGPGAVWNHDPAHRLGAAYRDAATRNRFRQFNPANSGNRETYRGHVPSFQPSLPQHARPSTGKPNLGAPARSAERAAPQSGMRVRPEYKPAPQQGLQGRPAPSPDNRSARRSSFASTQQQGHPFNPAGSAGAMQSQADRGRASREASRFHQPAAGPAATKGPEHKAAKHEAPADPQKHSRSR